MQSIFSFVSLSCFRGSQPLPTYLPTYLTYLKANCRCHAENPKLDQTSGFCSTPHSLVKSKKKKFTAIFSSETTSWS